MASDRGGTMVEYALILVTIAIIVVVGALVVGTITNDKYVDVGQCIDNYTTC
ncbi:MAG: Flp family type IVb pilin [Acidimicrobiia bacterium]|nr:Flp family type IVb pilin [Acidimicrobiia bacterium]